MDATQELQEPNTKKLSKLKYGIDFSPFFSFGEAKDLTDKGYRYYFYFRVRQCESLGKLDLAQCEILILHEKCHG